MALPEPSFAEEKRLRALGYRYIAGVDEAGRGALMGPVVAAAVMLPDVIGGKWKYRVRDSKLLRPEERDYLFECIREAALAVGTGMISHEVIDRVGIARATRLAMVEAISSLTPPPEYLLIDFFRLEEVGLPQEGIVDGDSLVFSIAAASIVAKVTRDRWVASIAPLYPAYGFDGNKGYGTKDHLECLQRLGPCPLHRRSFRPVSDMAGGRQ